MPFSRWNPPPRGWDACRRRVDPAFWARVPPPPPQPPRASLRVAASDPRCVSRPRLDARKSVRFRAVQASAKRGDGDSLTGEDGRTENVSAEARLRERRRQPPRSTRAARLGVHPGVAPRRRRRNSRRGYTHVVLAVGVFVFFSGRFASASGVGLRPRGSVAGDHLARSPATMAAARARRRWSNAPIARDDHDSRRGPDSESDMAAASDGGSSSSDERFESRLFLRSLRPANGTSDLRESPRGASRDAGAACRGESRPRWCPCRRTCGPSWPSWAGSNPSTTCQPAASTGGAGRVRLSGGARGLNDRAERESERDKDDDRDAAEAHRARRAKRMRRRGPHGGGGCRSGPQRRRPGSGGAEEGGVQGDEGQAGGTTRTEVREADAERR